MGKLLIAAENQLKHSARESAAFRGHTMSNFKKDGRLFEAT